ncbi:XAF1_2 [Blepharisma stoltei]|uniref:TRAFD1/XAF1 zinc finger domain-containing protein n=1 Tax=Blepharisma stoltei TaxID=1481888 RepID=A0AAU9IEL0_9CILI|nr:unnamed protein product [Blepharisma stoltei]
MEAEICEICHKEVPTLSMTMHRAHCERNTMRCLKCNELISKLAQEEHDLLYHQIKECSQCYARMEARYFEKHECPKAPSYCPYCEATYPLDLFQPHIQACGSRSEECEKCNRFILLKHFKSHQDSCGKEDSEKNIKAKDLQREIMREKEERKFVEPIQISREEARTKLDAENAEKELKAKQYQELQKQIIREGKEKKIIEPKISREEAKAKLDAENAEKELKARQYRDLQNQIEAERSKKMQLDNDRIKAEPRRPENILPNQEPKNRFATYELPPPSKKKEPPIYQGSHQQFPRNLEPINQPQIFPRFSEPINQPQFIPHRSDPIYQPQFVPNTSEDERIARELAQRLEREAKENIDRIIAEGLLRDEQESYQGYGPIIDDSDILAKKLLAKEDERLAKQLLAEEDEKLAKALLAKEDERLARQLAGNGRIPSDRSPNVLDYANFTNEQDYNYFGNSIQQNIYPYKQRQNIQQGDLTEEELLKIAMLESLNHK